MAIGPAAFDGRKGWRSWLDLTYRRMAEGACFLIFMCSGVITTLLILPLLDILPLAERLRQNARLGVIHLGFKLFFGLMCATRAMRFKVSGLEHLSKRPVIYIANHPSLIDVVAIFGLIPRCNCIVKANLLDHRYIGGAMRRSGLIANSAGLEVLARVEQEIKRHHSLIIFPEGTRSPQGGLNPFSRGAARLALQTGLPVVPIQIACDPPLLAKGKSWRDTPPYKVSYSLTIHPAWNPHEQVDDQLPMPRQVRSLNRQFEHFFQAGLAK